jgi:hypothetical protein
MVSYIHVFNPLPEDLSSFNLHINFGPLAHVYKRKISVFWKITSCNPLKVNRRFEETYQLHLLSLKLG